MFALASVAIAESPKVIPLLKEETLELENVDLKQQMLKMEFDRLQAIRTSLEARIYDRAKVTSDNYRIDRQLNSLVEILKPAAAAPKPESATP